MPKAKPVSLFPLSFEEAMSALIKVAPQREPKPPKRRRKRKAKGKK